jgi:CBS domain-containing protein
MTDESSESAQEEFNDPLENYDPPKHRNTLEKSLMEETVAAIQSRPYTSISPDSTIEQAVGVLAARGVACALVEEEGKLVGMFSDREILDKVALEYETMKDRPVRDVMTTNPIFVQESDSSAAALCVMAVMGYRHVPVLGRDHKIVGIVTPQRVTSFLLSRVDSPRA